MKILVTREWRDGEKDEETFTVDIKSAELFYRLLSWAYEPFTEDVFVTSREI